MTDPAIALRQIEAHDTIDLRHRVMWPDLPRQEVILPEDAYGLHFGAALGPDLIGVGSFFIDGPTARLRKLAVDKAAQGRGVASLLLAHAFARLTEKGVERVWCDARVSAMRFYLRNGFTLSPDMFQKRGLDYVVATREL